MGFSDKHYIGFLSFLLSILSFNLDAQVDFTYHSEYYFLKGKDAGSLPSSWMTPAFDYSGWEKGAAPFRYGDGTGGTELSDMLGGYTTLFLRTTFECSNKDLIQELNVFADYDDGFILWINGTMALSVNAPPYPSSSSIATANHESGTGTTYTVSTASLNLSNGTNYVAIIGLNVSNTSTDFYFDMEIHGEKNLPMLPDSLRAAFSANSGFYGNPFDLTIYSDDPSYQIIYTLDGSNPRNSPSGIVAANPVSLLIDPESSPGRPLSPGVIVRASLYKDGFKPSISESRTYIFPEKVGTQKYPGGGWPAYNVNGQVIDLDMDGEIVNSPAYSTQIVSSLLSIPAISVVTDLKNLFDPATGIYVNASGHGLEWERECSVELLNPDGSAGFNVNAGLRIRGGYSRGDGFPKHAFRLFFREKYGDDKLRYPLFGDEGVSEFDKIDLRTDQNYAWSNGSPFNSMVREVFSRDSQRDMGQPYTRSRYYHLYINGMYWGLYQTQERSEARYAGSYFGGNEEDYDVIKVNTETGYTVEATDGSIASWDALWNLCQKGFESNEDYFRLEGKDKDGKPVKGGKIMVDIDNLIDFMMVIFYTGNFDSPTASFMQNKKANNFYAIEDRIDNSRGFTFYVHDAEHAMFDEPHPPGAGLSEDRVNIGTQTGDMKMEVSDLSRFHPQWLHFRLSANPEYRIRFADRAWRHLSAGGVFSPEKAMERLDGRINEVDPAVVAESARWGDAGRTGQPYTKNDTWLPEVRKIRNNFIPGRTPVVAGQLRKAGLFPRVEAPVVKNGDVIEGDNDIRISSPVTIRIENPNGSGTIYYTLNGTDPRRTGGGVNTGVSFALNMATLELKGSTQINARILANGNWSALRKINFLSTREDYSGLKVTELNYHPPDLIKGVDTIPGQDLEFIEFKNTGKNAIGLEGTVLDSAIHYIFPSGSVLPPRQFFVVASKPSKFFDYYGMPASGNFSGNFSNAGERVRVMDPSGDAIMDFTYSDESPWPSGTDGDGFTLSSAEINPEGDPSVYNYWAVSVKKDGTPFADNLLSGGEVPGQLQDGSLVVFPNPTNGLITVQLLTDENESTVEVLIYSASGKIIKQAVIGNPGLIDLSGLGLPDGMYILKVNSSKYQARRAVILVK
jgi:hypothetical protein